MPFSPALWTPRQARLGETIRAWRPERCSCFDAQTQRWDRSHAVCEGTGIVLTELSISSYKAIVAKVAIDEAMKSYGMILTDDIKIETMPSQIPLAEGYEVQLQKSTRTVQIAESLRRGKDDRTFYDIASIISVRRNATTYILTTDYTFSGQTISWVIGRGPTEGQVYTVLYKARPRYVVHQTLLRGDEATTQSVVARIKQPDEVSVGIAGT